MNQSAHVLYVQEAVVLKGQILHLYLILFVSSSFVSLYVWQNRFFKLRAVYGDKIGFD